LYKFGLNHDNGAQTQKWQKSKASAACLVANSSAAWRKAFAEGTSRERVFRLWSSTGSLKLQVLLRRYLAVLGACHAPAELQQANTLQNKPCSGCAAMLFM
jgi:hypothetical protein